MNKIDSIVIVKWPEGFVATLRFTDPKLDKIFSSSNKNGIYSIINSYVKAIPNDKN